MKTLTKPIFILSGLTTEADASKPILSWWRAPRTQAYTVWITGPYNQDIDPIKFLETKGIKVVDQKATKDFLAQHNEVVKCLYDLPGKIADYFGETRLSLEIFIDPESTEQIRELSIMVRTKLSPKEANERLVKIYKEWFIPQGRCLEKVTISLSFY